MHSRTLCLTWRILYPSHISKCWYEAQSNPGLLVILFMTKTKKLLISGLHSILVKVPKLLVDKTPLHTIPCGKTDHHWASPLPQSKLSDL